MKAIQATSYGTAPLNISLQTDVPKPTIEPKSNKVLIKTEAVALAPGDVRTLSGKTRELQGPPSFPYIPGADCCGVIVDLGVDYKQDKDVLFNLKVGDRIAARFVDFPRGALGEYALVSTKMCDVVPTDGKNQISSIEAAALASSATVALSLSRRITEDDGDASPKRVLVLGAGGGVGSHLCQFLKLKKNVDFVAGVSSDTKWLLGDPIKCDQAVDYTKQDPLSVQEWKDEQFDIIYDLSSAGTWDRLMEQKNKGDKLIIKSASEGGKFLTVTDDEAWFELHSIWQAVKKFMFKPLWRAVYSRWFGVRSKLPSYTFAMSLDIDRSIMRDTLNLAKEGKIQACVDQRGPFAFTTDGVKEAFEIQESCHIHGKVVINLC
jgi:NADPH:quinone reductase-like Zn-dependent oxidoreductase